MDPCGAVPTNSDRQTASLAHKTVLVGSGEALMEETYNTLQSQHEDVNSKHSRTTSTNSITKLVSRPAPRQPTRQSTSNRSTTIMSRHSSSKNSKQSPYQLMSSDSPADQAKAMSQVSPGFIFVIFLCPALISSLSPILSSSFSSRLSCSAFQLFLCAHTPAQLSADFA